MHMVMAEKTPPGPHDRVRTVLVIEEELRETLRVEASMSGRDMSDIVEDLIRDALVDTLRLLRERRSAAADRETRSAKNNKRGS